MILLSIVGGLVSYSYIKRIGRDLDRVVLIEEPLEETVLEIEINAGETARAVLDYVRDLEPKHIVVIGIPRTTSSASPRTSSALRKPTTSAGSAGRSPGPRKIDGKEQ